MTDPFEPPGELPELTWVGWADRELRTQVEAVVRPVVDAGGAVGWAATPTSAALDGWLDTVLDDVRAGDARLLTASVAGSVVALGRWHRLTATVFQHVAELRQVMVHPDARGQGLGRQVVGALVDDAREHDLENLSLEVRGNNHGAMRLYESLGFVRVGAYPEHVAVGADRWDRVLFNLDLGARPGVVRHGGRREGAGAS